MDCRFDEMVEFAAGDPAAVRRLFAEKRMEPALVLGMTKLDLVGAGEAFEAAFDEIRSRAATAVQFGGTEFAAVLKCRSQAPIEEIWPDVVDRIRQVDQALDGTGLKLALEFQGVKTLHPDDPHQFVRSMAEMNRLLEAAEAAHVGMILDSYHWYAAGDSLDTIRRTPASRILFVHVNDAPDLPRNDLRDDARLLPGEGVIPLAEFLAAIAATGYQGYVGMEVLGPRMQGMGVEARAAAAVERVPA